MTQSVSRQQRKQMMKEAFKKGMSGTQGITGNLEMVKPLNLPAPQTNAVTEERLQTVIQDLQKILNYAKYVENRLWLLTETTIRKGLVSMADISETESLYIQKEELKREKIKELLSQDKTVLEYLDLIKEAPNLLGYQKLAINPVKDLNLNPYEVGATLREIHPTLTKEQYLELGRKWDLNQEHMGYKKPE